MKKHGVIIAVFMVIGLFAAMSIPVTGPETGNTAFAFEKKDFPSKQTGSLGRGDALIELTPGIDNNKLVVEFSINTHSVRLSRYDLTEITTLKYNGKKVLPLKASRIGGHHSSGEIVFDIDSDPESFSIVIQGIPQVEERVYTWNRG